MMSFEIKFKFIRTWQPAIPWMKISLADLEFCENRLNEISDCYGLLDDEMAAKKINYTDSHYCESALTACHVAAVLSNLERDIENRIRIIKHGYDKVNDFVPYTKPMRQGK